MRGVPCSVGGRLGVGLAFFFLAAAPATAQRAAQGVKVLAAGDVAGCDSSGDEQTANLLDRLPGTILALGDLAYDDGTLEEFEDCYHPTWGRHKARTKPVPGNHEYSTDGAEGYYDYFGAAAGDPNRGYYSYELGNWHVVALNSNCADIGGCERSSAQGRWLAQDLAANPSACTLAYWHHPRFSSSEKHGSSTLTRDLWAILMEHGADLVLQGHDHNYERFAPQDADGNATPFGIRSFVVGTGGRSHYGFTDAESNSEVRNGTDYGVLELTLRPMSYAWRFVPVQGQTFTDSGSSPCVGTACGIGPELAALVPLLFAIRARRRRGPSEE
jgi:3',5'-cyclic AMP phosphodiesterase CpdA